jgi:hypothetical protein
LLHRPYLRDGYFNATLTIQFPTRRAELVETAPVSLS